MSPVWGNFFFLQNTTVKTSQGTRNNNFFQNTTVKTFFFQLRQVREQGTAFFLQNTTVKTKSGKKEQQDLTNDRQSGKTRNYADLRISVRKTGTQYIARNAA